MSKKIVLFYGKPEAINLSEEALKALGVPVEEMDWERKWQAAWEIMTKRDDPKLIEVIERLGQRADTRDTHVAVVEIDDDVDWDILKDGGVEVIVERGRVWRMPAWGGMPPWHKG